MKRTTFGLLVFRPAFALFVLSLKGLGAEATSEAPPPPPAVIQGHSATLSVRPQPPAPAAPAVPRVHSIPAIPLIKPTVTAAAPAGPGPEALKGKPLPRFEMNTITGETLSNESLRGKVLLIDFWATWCGPCRRAAPTLQRLHERFADAGLVVIGANTSERNAEGKSIQTPDRARDYAREHKYGYTFTYGADAFKNACGVRGLPTMIVVGREGRVRDVAVGYALDLEERLRKMITPLLD